MSFCKDCKHFEYDSRPKHIGSISSFCNRLVAQAEDLVNGKTSHVLGGSCYDQRKKASGFLEWVFEYDRCGVEGKYFEPQEGK